MVENVKLIITANFSKYNTSREEESDGVNCADIYSWHS